MLIITIHQLRQVVSVLISGAEIYGCLDITYSMLRTLTRHFYSST